MTDTELAAIVDGLAPVIRDYVTRVHGELVRRVAELETRSLLPGPPGPPGLEFRGVFVEGHAYDAGQLVTWAGSSWHCNEPTTTKPGEGSNAWTLMVKRGRDGKDGKDGGPGPQGPTGKDWQQVYDDTRRR